MEQSFNTNISFIQPKDAWDALSMREKAEMMKVAVNHGITNLQDIRQRYNEFAMGGDTEDTEPLSLNEAKRMGVMVGASLFKQPKAYIGGTPSEARDKYWQQDNEMRILTDSVASRYNLNPDLLRSRMDSEGYTDSRIAENNIDVKTGSNKALTGEALFHSQTLPVDAIHEFGFDDVATYINNGTVSLINENWGDGQFENEKGRTTHAASGHNYSDNIGIMAATLKGLREVARKDFPNASEADLDRYAQAYYNRGITGGREWVKRGAKGYKVTKHSLGGPLVDAAMNKYKSGGGIHIKPSHRGRLTELKKRTGKSEAELYRTGSPATRKMITFARNARKWKHGDGGNLFSGEEHHSQQMNIGLNTTNGWRPYTFGEIVANGEKVVRQREALEEAMRNFQIESNDATSIAGGRPQNTHLEGKAVRGGAANAAWEKEHPNLTAWSYLPSAAVIGTALAPLGAAGWTGISALGDTAAATSAGQAITSGLNFAANAAKATPWVSAVLPYVDPALTSIFGAHGVSEAMEGNFTPMTALEVAPLGRLAKPTWNVGKEAMAEIQSLYNNYPIRNYNIDAILKSDFYNKISEQYGKEFADDLAQKLTSKEFRDYLFGDNPRKAFKDADRHLEQMQFIKDVENAGGLLGGSGQLARVGTVNREGLMHDLDFFVPGSMGSKTSPVVDALGLNKHNEPLLSAFGPTGVKPKMFNNTMGSVDKGYINLPQERGNVEADMFIRDHMPTKDEAVNIILDVKRQFGRPKDIADIEAFKHYSADNPIIDINTGRGQWNPTLFDEGLFTGERYPFVQSVETYPGSGVRVPAVMNYKGEIRSLVRRPPTANTTQEITAENAASTIPTGNVTDNLLKWLGVPKERQIEKSALDYLNSRFSPEYQRMAQMLQDNGVDLSKLDARDIKKILDKRFEELRNSGQERLSVARPTGDRHFSVADFVSGKERPVGEMGLEMTEDGTALVTDITNYTRNSLTPVKGVQERGLNSAINISKSVGGRGVVTGREYQSAPRQYHVIQKFRDRDIVGHDGIHYNSNMVNDYENRMGLPGTYDETVISQDKDIWKGMLELARAGEKERKALYGAPVWRLGTPTFDTPTKSLLFDPRIIDRNGRMIIDWSNPNIFRSFGGHLYTKE